MMLIFWNIVSSTWTLDVTTLKRQWKNNNVKFPCVHAYFPMVIVNSSQLSSQQNFLLSSGNGQDGLWKSNCQRQKSFIHKFQLPCCIQLQYLCYICTYKQCIGTFIVWPQAPLLPHLPPWDLCATLSWAIFASVLHFSGILWRHGEFLSGLGMGGGGR
jgi:hypothetical protein